VGFRFRKSFKVLPGIRLNLSGSGASVSFGPRGLRYTAGPKGTRVTASIPGTGLSWTEYSPHHKRLPVAAPSSPSDAEFQPRVRSEHHPELIPIESAPLEQINALSTSELAILLNAAQRRIRFAPFVLGFCLCMFVAAAMLGNQLALGLVALLTTVFVPISIYLDRYRRSVRIDYELSGIAKTVAAALAESFGDLQGCKKVWSISAHGYTADWKRHAGATKLIDRKRIYPNFEDPECLRGATKFPCVRLGKEQLFFLSDAVLVVTKTGVTAIDYRDLVISSRQTRFIEEETTPSDTKVLDQTWQYSIRRVARIAASTSTSSCPSACMERSTLSPTAVSTVRFNCRIRTRWIASPKSSTRFLVPIHRQFSPKLSRPLETPRLGRLFSLAARLFCLALLSACSFSPHTNTSCRLRTPVPDRSATQAHLLSHRKKRLEKSKLSFRLPQSNPRQSRCLVLVRIQSIGDRRTTLLIVACDTSQEFWRRPSRRRPAG
jgi:hypothetical protein